MRFDRVWNVPTSEIQNLRNVKIKNRGSRESGEKNGSREREKLEKEWGKMGLGRAKRRKPIKHL